MEEKVVAPAAEASDSTVAADWNFMADGSHWTILDYKVADWWHDVTTKTWKAARHAFECLLSRHGAGLAPSSPATRDKQLLDWDTPWPIAAGELGSRGVREKFLERSNGLN